MQTLRARVLTPDVRPSATPSDHPLRWIDDAVVCVDDAGRLSEVAPYDGRDVDADLRPGVLMPGWVDGHVHFPQMRIVGSASGPLLAWLDRSTFPEERRFLDPDYAATVARDFAATLAAAGTTSSFVYGSVHPQATDALLGAFDARGLRTIAGPVLMDSHSPKALLLPMSEALPAVEALADRWHGHDDRLQVAVIPRFALSCTAQAMAEAGDLAQRRGLWVSTHLAENPAECAEAERRFGAPDYLSVYEDAGLVHERSVFAHCIHLSDDAWDRFAAAGAVVAHCPDSNAFLGSGHMPTGDVVGRGIPLVIGTDVAAGRSFRVPRILSYAYDNALAVGYAPTPAQLLWWGTRTGALALGLPQVGAVEAGLDADMVLVDVPAWVESADEVLGWTLFWTDAPWPRRTWVRGRVVWDRGAGAFPWSEHP